MKRLLYRLSKTDKVFVSRCNEETQLHQRSLGMFVLLTALFAFASGYYALTTVFGTWNTMSMQYELTIKQNLLVFICATLYAVMIGSIDREIVSAKNKWAAGLRLPLALAIGFVISVPIELKVLENKINQQIQENQTQKLMPFKQQKDDFIEKAEKDINDIEIQISYYTQKRIEASNRAAKEDMGIWGEGLTGISGQGKHYGYAKEEEQNYTSEIKKLNELKNEKLQYRNERLKQLDRDFSIYKTNAVFDFWEKYNVMHQIIREDKTGQSRIMTLAISALFILLELIPSIIKMLSSKNEYDLILEYKMEKIKIRLQKELEKEDDEITDFITLPELRVENLICE